MIDRLDAMRVFVTALDEGSLARAGQCLHRSPAAVTRAIASLESRVGAKLLHRTTRRLELTEAGQQYAGVYRRVLADLEEADLAVAGNRVAPHGVLTVTAPVMFGTRVLRPVVGEFLRVYPAMQVRYLLLNRMTNFVDEGIDVALRIAPLQASSLVAVRIGEVRRVLCASPKYLAGRPPIKTLSDLAQHDCIGIEPTSPNDIWSFPPANGGRIARTVRVKPRLMVNTDEAAVSAAVDGEGIVRIFSYKIQHEVTGGGLVVLLPEDEPPPVPVHLVTSPDRLALVKVRTFMDFAAARLRADFERTTANREDQRSHRGPLGVEVLHHRLIPHQDGPEPLPRSP